MEVLVFISIQTFVRGGLLDICTYIVDSEMGGEEDNKEIRFLIKKK